MVGMNDNINRQPAPKPATPQPQPINQQPPKPVAGTPSQNQASTNNNSTNTNIDPVYKQEHREVKKSLAGATWVGLIVGVLLLIVLLVFILQNQESAELQLFAWTMTFPIGVGMLIAAIVGALIMALVGGVRIVQLRKQVTQ
ncbi:lipopolysaccharide assembly LapA domain-containing protein [Corynebacterium sp. YSMAA1_1_F7]|uniref:LapA family protein n=2 Tax=Corynebacterium TaxID=1716 RepID=UPI0038D099C4